MSKRPPDEASSSKDNKRPKHRPSTRENSNYNSEEEALNDIMKEFLQDEEEKERNKQQEEDDKNRQLKTIPGLKTVTTHVGDWEGRNIRHLISMREIKLLNQNATTRRLLNRVIEMLGKWWFQFPINTLAKYNNHIDPKEEHPDDNFKKQSNNEQQVIRDRNTFKLNTKDREHKNTDFLYLYMLLVVCENVYIYNGLHYPFIEYFSTENRSITNYLQKTARIMRNQNETVRPAFVRMLYSLHRHHNFPESKHADATNSPTVTLYVMSSIIRYFENMETYVRTRIQDDLDFIRQRLNIIGNISDWLLSNTARQTIGLQPTNTNLWAIGDTVVEDFEHIFPDPNNLLSRDEVIRRLTPDMPWIATFTEEELDNANIMATNYIRGIGSGVLALNAPISKYLYVFVIWLWMIGAQKNNPDAHINHKKIKEFLDDGTSKDTQDKSELDKVQDEAKAKSWIQRNPKAYKGILWTAGILGGVVAIAAIITNQEWLLATLARVSPAISGALPEGGTALTEGIEATGGAIGEAVEATGETVEATGETVEATGEGASETTTPSEKIDWKQASDVRAQGTSDIPSKPKPTKTSSIELKTIKPKKD